MHRYLWLPFVAASFSQVYSQQPPAAFDPRVYAIADSVSPVRIEDYVHKLVSFGTRHTLSDTSSDTRGIGAARRWIKAEFEQISVECGGCLEVSYLRTLVPAGTNGRIFEDVWVVSVIAIQRGDKYPDRFIIMSGDIDSRITDPNNATDDSPGANDNASGMAGTIEAARVLTRYRFPTSIVFAALAGEEQGLFGGAHLAAVAVEEGWDVVGVLNNDMIGNIEGGDGVIDNRTFRIFSEPTPVTEPEETLRRRRYTGGEVDGTSRQLARYVDRMTSLYLPQLTPMMIYRLDRFGRGGHHRPFNDAGFAGVRIMEAHENYTRQHQDVRMEDGIAYGDVMDGVNFDYAANLTRVNAIALAGLAWAPPEPDTVWIGGAVQPSTRLRWTAVDDEHLAGYKIYWRDTTAPQWQYSRVVRSDTTYTLEGIVIDNYLFGVVSVGKDGNESVVVFPIAGY